MASRSVTQDNEESSQLAACMSKEDVERKAAEVVQHFLILEQKKLPVKRPDLVKSYELRGRNFKRVLDQANNILQKVFGYAVHELNSKHNHFILKAITEPNCNLITPNDLNKQHGLLFLVLSAIYLSGGKLNEDDLWLILDTLSFSEEEKNLVNTDLEKQHYIATEIVPESEPVKRVFLWGERAELEVSKLDVIDFASKIYNTPRETFGKLYTELTEQQDTSTSQQE